MVLEKVKISIVIPTKNRSSIIDIAFNSIKNLNYKPDELVVIEAGESMTSINKAKSLFLEDKVIKLNTIFNKGSIRTDNWLKGIQACENKYVLILCDDDEIMPDVIKKFENAINKCDKASVYFCRQNIVDSLNNKKFLHMKDWEEGFYSQKQLFKNLKEKGFPGFPTILINKDSLMLSKNSLCVFEEADYVCDLFLLIDALILDGAYFVDYMGSNFYYNQFSQSTNDGLSLIWPNWPINIDRLNKLNQSEISQYFKKRLVKRTITNALYLIYKKDFKELQSLIQINIKHIKKYKYSLLRIFFIIIKFKIIAVFLKFIISVYKKFNFKKRNWYQF